MFDFYLGLPHIRFAHLACQTAPNPQVHYIAELANPRLSGDSIAVHFSAIMSESTCVVGTCIRMLLRNQKLGIGLKWVGEGYTCTMWSGQAMILEGLILLE